MYALVCATRARSLRSACLAYVSLTHVPMLSCTQVVTDAVRVRQIVMNGLTNSAKYARVTVSEPIRVAVYLDDDPTGGHGAAAGAPPATEAVPGGAGDTMVRVGPRASAGASDGTAWLCIDVLDQGAGLRGVDEEVLFRDFAAPVGTSTLNHHISSGHESSGGSKSSGSKPRIITVGSSGLGLPICAR